MHAELVLGRGIQVGHNAVAMLMQRAGIAGRNGARKWRGVPGTRPPRTSSTAASAASGPNELWLTDITEHPTREGKVYCAVVLDAFSRRVVGWSISHNPTAALTCNALGMAIEQRDAQPRQTVIHSDHGTHFTSWAFTDRARQVGAAAVDGLRRRLLRYSVENRVCSCSAGRGLTLAFDWSCALALICRSVRRPGGRAQQPVGRT